MRSIDDTGPDVPDEPIGDAELARITDGIRRAVGTDLDDVDARRLVQSAIATTPDWASGATLRRRRVRRAARSAGGLALLVTFSVGATAAGLLPDSIAGPIDRIGETVGVDVVRDDEARTGTTFTPVTTIGDTDDSDGSGSTDRTDLAPGDPSGPASSSAIDGTAGPDPIEASDPGADPRSTDAVIEASTSAPEDESAQPPPATTPTNPPPTTAPTSTTTTPTTTTTTSTTTTTTSPPTTAAVVVEFPDYDSTSTDEPVVLPHDPRIELASGTITATIQPDRLLNRRYGIFSKSADPSADGDLSVFVGKTGRVAVRWRSGDELHQIESWPIAVDEPSEIEVDFGATGVALRVDGRLVGRSYEPASLVGNDVPTVIAGLDWESDAGDVTNAFDGTITDLRLTASEPAGSTSLPDFDSEFDDPKIVGATADHEIASGRLGFTVSHSVRSGRRGGIISKDAEGNGDGGHLSVYIDGSGRLVARLDSADDDHSVTSDVLDRNRSYDVVLEFGPGGMKLTVDGVEVDTDPHTGSTLGNTETLIVGALGWSSAPGGDDVTNTFSGSITDVRFGPS
ncbi:MAG: LamG-like jellyroll fold domain-containing protein [Actinomycetota bacterium]